MDYKALKAETRTRCLAARDAIPVSERIDKSLVMADLAADIIAFEPGEIVSGFFPIRSEADIRPLMHRLKGRGARLCLPVVLDRQTIAFREIADGIPMVDTGFGTTGPGPDAPVVDPDLLLMPLSAFDGNGNRIGYGAGHYDRAIARLRARGLRPRLIGIAFDCQKVEAVPYEPHDVPLDAILTESGLHFFAQEAWMRLLFLGDMVGKSGRQAVWERLPGLISDYRLDFVIVNGENAAGGFGITEDIFTGTIAAGADVVTTGNHVWDQREALVFADRHDQFLRPANYPAGTPGKGSGLFVARNGARVLVANIMGRVFMHPDLDDPFKSAEAVLSACPLGEQADAVIFDFHAEATSEKQCFGHFVDGRASLVVGTHTHVPTADHQIFAGGTAYMSDAGMCGDYDSSLGMDKEEPINRFLTKIPRGRFEAASGPGTICGLAVEISDRTGLAEAVAPLRMGPRLAETLPSFW